jgi:hypothetical protein
VNLEAIDGTDVQGWNRAPHHAVYWSQFNIYVIRAFGDCQKEVNVLYTDVLPKIRQVMLGCAINVQLRDLGSISRPLPKDRPPEYKAPIGISLSSIQERNSVCLILVGFDYGGSWKTTSGTVSLKDLGLEDPDEADFPEELSELEILAMRAAQLCEVKHTVFTSKKSAPRTFMYTCVDPDSPFRYQGGLSPMAIRYYCILMCLRVIVFFCELDVSALIFLCQSGNLEIHSLRRIRRRTLSKRSWQRLHRIQSIQLLGAGVLSAARVLASGVLSIVTRSMALRAVCPL